ncbi:MAG: UDP-N-acetylmuramate dehydrogenase [Bacteroidota bacterium]
MEIVNNHRITDLTTFGVNAFAGCFAEATTEDEVRAVFRNDLFLNNNRLTLGAGSNLLFTKDFEGFILRINLRGISIAGETEEFVFVKVAAGEVWDDFVNWCIERNLGGTENMVAIPGMVGSSAVQNIGAYGSEVKDIIHEVETLEIPTGKTHILTNAECNFAYRDSIFKHPDGENFVVISVLFKLSKKSVPNIGYGDVAAELKSAGVEKPSIADVANIIRSIRLRKLPDPKDIGNAGSFFKNPVIEKSQHDTLKQTYLNIPGYIVNDTFVKVPAAWLIEQCGWKGFRKGDAGVYEKQPLVLVNYGNATGQEILTLAENIRASVLETFNIRLEFEVRIV